MGCKDGVKFPWSKDKPHEAEVTTDTTDTAIDSTETQAMTDSLAMLLNDSIANQGQEEQEAEVSSIKQWRVVVSSMPTQSLADKFRDRNGVSQAQVYYVDRLNTYRVVYGSFPELSDAQVEFGIIKSEFPDAWLVYF